MTTVNQQDGSPSAQPDLRPPEPARGGTAVVPGAAAGTPSGALPDAPSADGASGRPAPQRVRIAGERSRRRRVRVPRLVRRLVVPVVIIALWQLACSDGFFTPDELASPSTVVTTAWHLIQDGSLPDAIEVSLRRVLFGLLFGGIAGIGLGLFAGLFRLGEDAVDATLQMLRTVPFVGLTSLLIIWFGIGEESKIVLVSLGVTFPLYLNTYAGVRTVDAGLVEAGRTLGLSRLGLVAHVVLPAALPNILVGLRQSLGVAWLALVFAEQVNTTTGIGYLMNNARELFQTDVIIVCLAVYAFLGLITDLIVRTLEKGLLTWRPSFTGA